MRWRPKPPLLAVGLALVLAAPAGAATRLVRYDVAGSIRGESSRLIVDTDGSAEQTGRSERSFEVSAGRLRTLKTALRDAHFLTLKRRYAPKQPVFDGITQTVRYNGYAVSLSSAATAPPRFERVLRLLEGLMR
jgi:hypothetical protein